MNATELKAICQQINKLPLTWNQRAYHLTTRLQAEDVFFEEAGADADWRVNVVFDDNKGATVHYDGGLKVSLQDTEPTPHEDEAKERWESEAYAKEVADRQSIIEMDR